VVYNSVSSSVRSDGGEGKKLDNKSVSGSLLLACMWTRLLNVDLEGLMRRKDDLVVFKGGYVAIVETSEKARIESNGLDSRISPGGGKESTRSYCASEKRLAREY
jgi:hypothetical protein